MRRCACQVAGVDFFLARGDGFWEGNVREKEEGLGGRLLDREG